MQIKEIEELIQLIERSEIEEFELERSGTKIRIRKSGAGTTSWVATGPPAAAGPTAAPIDPAPQVAPTDATPAPPDVDTSLETFTAPIVGTFYLSSKPDAEPFVQVGDSVRKGKVLCIIEAMKIFNQIESDIDGEIVKILVENGQPVEYGEALFELRPHS